MRAPAIAVRPRVRTWKSHPPRFRSVHTFSSRRSVAEALPVARPATYAKEHSWPALDEVLARRARAGKLVAGVAAASDSDMFKGLSHDKPLAKRWDAHISYESAERKPCTLKLAARHLKQPGLISLGGGLPSSEYFPFASLSMQVPQPPHFTESETLSSGQTLHIGKYDVIEQRSLPTGATYDLSIALNYGQSTGSAQMMRFVTEHTELVYSPPYADWQCCQTVGSTGALEQALRLLLDKDRNDSVLTEAYSFSTALETIAPLGIKAFGVPIDEQGLLPAKMDEILTTWDDHARGARKPHVLYTVPSGQNPTGATQGAARRRQIYEVAQKHNLYIIEDEPYYFLQMEPYASRGRGAPATPPSTIPEFLASLIPSLLSMDVDGRVMRMDSFSKVLVPGSRLGWITASAQMVERYIRHAEVANQGPSGFSQVIIHKLLDESWGHEGYLRWLMSLRLEYTKRRDTILQACEEHLPEVVSWNPPAAGMFLWLRVDPTTHPALEHRSLLEIEDEIFNSCIRKGVLVARGSWFRTEQDGPLGELFFRATYAAASPANMTEAIRRFGEAVRESFGMQ